MIRTLRSLLVLSAALILGAAAHAAPNANSNSVAFAFTCDSSPVLNLTPVSFSLPLSAASTPSGAGEGKLTYSPFTIQFRANNAYESLVSQLRSGERFTSCKLTQTVVAQTATGDLATTVFSWNFKQVWLTNLTASGDDGSMIGRNPDQQPVALIHATFAYTTLQVRVGQ